MSTTIFWDADHDPVATAYAGPATENGSRMRVTIGHAGNEADLSAEEALGLGQVLTEWAQAHMGTDATLDQRVASLLGATHWRDWSVEELAASVRYESARVEVSLGRLHDNGRVEVTPSGLYRGVQGGDDE